MTWSNQRNSFCIQFFSYVFTPFEEEGEEEGDVLGGESNLEETLEKSLEESLKEEAPAKNKQN